MKHACELLNGRVERRPSGVGVGLRAVHYDEIRETRPEVPWFEAVSENYMGLRGQSGGRPLEMLESIRKDYPIMLHGVSMNIGSVDPLRSDYLIKLRTLADRVQPLWVSDHLCWTGVEDENLHDLLPLPFTEEALRHVVSRVRQVQDVLGRRILLENVSSYVSYAASEMPEWEFLCEVAARADCGILLDVNNVFVSATNHGFDPRAYLRGIPKERVGYMHLAGYQEQHGLLIDTHDQPVTDPVWALYKEAIQLFGEVPCLIEWDEQIPPLSRLLAEAKKAEHIKNEVLHEQAPAIAV